MSDDIIERVGRGHLIRSIAVDDEGVFYVSLSRKLVALVSATAFCAAVAIIALSVIALTNATRIGQQQTVLKAQQAVLFDSALGGCQRVQYLRDDFNQFTGAVYAFLAAAQRARVGAYAESHDRNDLVAARAYTVILDAVQYVPPTDCIKAVRDPLDYVAPQPIKYSTAVRLKLVTPPSVKIR